VAAAVKNLHLPDARRAASAHHGPMATVVLLADPQSGRRVVARPARLRERLAARWRAGSLERELARGASPATAAALALRAQWLIGPAARDALARRLLRVLGDARRGHPWPGTKVRPRRRAVAAAAQEMDLVAARLLAPGPVSARGVARVRLLLSDGCGPLYFDGSGVDLRAAMARALEDLEPRRDLLPRRA
jgi:hypothetical protein